MSRRTIAILCGLLLAAGGATASSFFPTDPGVRWQLTGTPGSGDWTYVLGSPQIWQGGVCQPRTELGDGQLFGTTYWSVAAGGDVLLHGLAHAPGGPGTWFFDPPVVYLDDDLQPGEQRQTETRVYELLDDGQQYYGLHTVVVTCVARDPVTTPLGTFPAISVTCDWPTSSAGAPWRYAAGGELAYGLQIGPVRIRPEGAATPQWLLTAVDGLTVTAAPLVPDAPTLQAGPNPFNPATTFRFALPGEGPVRLEVFDLAGRRVAVVCDAVLPAGPQAIAWQPRQLASGSYLARLQTPAGVATTRLMLLE